MIFGKSKEVERLEAELKELKADNDRLQRKLRLVAGEVGENSLTMRSVVSSGDASSQSIHGLDTAYLVVDGDLKVKALNSKMCTFLGVERTIATQRPHISELDRLDWAKDVLTTLLLESKAANGVPAEFEGKCPGDRQSGMRYFHFKAIWTQSAGTITVEDVTKLHRTRQTFERLVSPRIVAELLDSGADVFTASSRIMTVLFADLRGFTYFCDRSAPESVSRVVNDFMGTAVSLIEQHGATLDKFVGDQVMVLFGAPVVRDDHAYQAVRFALDLQNQHLAARNRWIEQGLLRKELLDVEPALLELGVGINTGEMVVGFFGSERGSQYTTMGHEVNLSARLCGKAEPGEILCGMRTVNEIATLYKVDPRRMDHVLKFKRKGEIEVKGVTDPIPVASLIYGKRV
jgi:class 3 adenylate cyclase